MDRTHKTLDPDPKPKTLPFPNGALKKHHHHHHHHHPRPPQQAPSLYRECLKNHAASLGGHALDGCGEFMPSPSSNPADPTSLTCAACGCHRNFHRRLLHPHPQEGEDEMDGQDEDNEDNDDNDERRHSSSPPPSAPHMLLALSAGLSAGPTPAVGSGVLPRKRFRSKFSPDQKERMHELSEKLGWRMQKRDEGLVEECCKEIGVGKGVFKVWMHNNKHNFVGSRKGEGGGGGGGVVEGNGSGGDGGNSHVVNGSTSSS